MSTFGHPNLKITHLKKNLDVFDSNVSFTSLPQSALALFLNKVTSVHSHTVA